MASIFDKLTSTNDKNKTADLFAAVEEDNSANVTEDSIVLDAATATTHKNLKELSQQLLKYGLLESATKPALYQAAVRQQQELNAILEPLDLSLKIDDIRGLAFVVVAAGSFDGDDDDQWAHPLVRRQRLNLEQSLLIAILRQHFVNHELETGVGDNSAIVHLDELLPQLNTYLGELGSETREDKRLRNLLDQLKAYGMVTDINEHEQVKIRPLIAHVANPENLKNLLATLKRSNNNRTEESAR